MGIRVGLCETYVFANWHLRKSASCPPTEAGGWGPYIQVWAGRNSQFFWQPWVFSGSTLLRGTRVILGMQPWTFRNYVSICSSSRPRLRPSQEEGSEETDESWVRGGLCHHLWVRRLPSHPSPAFPPVLLPSSWAMMGGRQDRLSTRP